MLLLAKPNYIKLALLQHQIVTQHTFATSCITCMKMQGCTKSNLKLS